VRILREKCLGPGTTYNRRYLALHIVCRLKECSYHIACSNFQVVLGILSSSTQNLSSYNTHVNNNVTDIFKSAGYRKVVKQGYGAHASNPKQYSYSQFNNA